MFKFLLKQWKLAVILFVGLDFLLVAALVSVFAVQETRRVAAAELVKLTPLPTATASATPTPWPGPGRRVTPTPTLPPTVTPTEVLAASGFPPGFTPTPRPTREQVKITLPRIFPVYGNNLDVPVINQIYYPEPFFPPGSNNACGPVALYAGLHALGTNVNYTRLRDVAVANGFTSYGISKSGMVGTVAYLNQEMGDILRFEHGNRYSTGDLIKQVRTGGVVIVLLNVRKVGGQFQVTADTTNSFGHFLIVDSINLRSKTVQFAGSTLGMEKVALTDFIQAWSQSPPPAVATGPTWQSFLKNEQSDNWALIIRRK